MLVEATALERSEVDVPELMIDLLEGDVYAGPRLDRSRSLLVQGHLLHCSMRTSEASTKDT
jgi:hypothetical protein